MCLMCQTLDPGADGYDSHGLDGTELSGTGTGGSFAALPTYTLDQIADQLTDGYWNSTGRAMRAFDVAPGDTLTYSLTGLTTNGKTYANQAIAAWEAVTGIHFQLVTSGAQIAINDADTSGAYATSTVIGNTIQSSAVNVPDSWKSSGGYYLQTFIHEIGHAMGLGHAGNYNGSASYGSDAHYANESWQVSVMSYFSQTDNTTTDASYNFLATAQLADILAMHNLYGVPTNVNTGDTIYGDGTTLSQTGMDLNTNWAVAIVDSGGSDTIDLGSRSADQRLSLLAETWSDLNGEVGNFAIARGTVIENAITGSGADTITGNDADNRLEGKGGDDILIGGAGADTLVGGAGADTLTGGAGADRFGYADLAAAGDTITDFSVAQGDQVAVSLLLQGLGIDTGTAIGNGQVALQAASGGSWVIVDEDGAGAGAGVQLAFLAGVSAAAGIAAVTDLTGAGGSTGAGSSGSGGGTDTTYTLSDSFADTWTGEDSILADVDGGHDTLDLSAVTYRARIHLDEGIAGDIDRKGLVLAGGSDIEDLLLGAGNDYGYGNDLANAISGNDGRDKLYGRGGDDVLSGGADNDTLYGEDGADSLLGEAGRDQLRGGAGDDTLLGGVDNDKLYGGDGDDWLEGGLDNDALYGELGNDTLLGGMGDDKLYGKAGDDSLEGGQGDDNLNGDEGDDYLDAGDGDDRLGGDDGDDTLLGGDGNDRLDGNDGNDSLDGGAGDDTLRGHDGDDTLTGGGGADRLDGGDGADTFVFLSLGDAGDDLRDFTAAEGDVIDVTAILDGLGTDVAGAIADGVLALRDDDGRSSWLVVDEDGTGGADGIDLVHLYHIAATTALEEAWFA